MLPQPTNKTSSSAIHSPSWALQSQVAPSFLTEVRVKLWMSRALHAGTLLPSFSALPDLIITCIKQPSNPKQDKTTSCGNYIQH